MDVYGGLNRASDAADAFASGGGADPWTRVLLAAAFTTGGIAFSDIPGFTLPALAIGKQIIVEGEMALVTVGTTNMPRIGFAYTAGFRDLSLSIALSSGAAAKSYTEGFLLNPTASVLQVPAGTAPSTNPFLVQIVAKGVVGGAALGAGALKLQLAAESAATNAASVREGAEWRYRILN